MPLPNLHKRCTVTARSTGERCKNPAAYGCSSCRYHGARRPTSIRKGKDHPQYKHGSYSGETKKEYREARVRLRTLEDLAHSVGMIEKPHGKRR
jgi:hypothetical protein